jgi:hypothetical protein
MDCIGQMLNKSPTQLPLGCPFHYRGSAIAELFSLSASQHHTTMKTWIAILFTIGLLAACIFISPLIGFDLTWLMVLGTALWAAIDSSKIKLKRYKSGISYAPVALFIACVLLWIVGFPWYLSMRYKIKTGTAVLKEGAANDAA